MTSVLNFIGNREAQRSHVGIGILLAAAVVVMPWLALRLPTFVSASSGVVGSSRLILGNSKPTRKLMALSLNNLLGMLWTQRLLPDRERATPGQTPRSLEQLWSNLRGAWN